MNPGFLLMLMSTTAWALIIAALRGAGAM